MLKDVRIFWTIFNFRYKQVLYRIPSTVSSHVLHILTEHMFSIHIFMIENLPQTGSCPV